jgi:hypothetical protein
MRSKSFCDVTWKTNRTKIMSKGDKPRNCFSRKFKDNFAKINWSKLQTEMVGKTKVTAAEYWPTPRFKESRNGPKIRRVYK